MQQSFHIPLVPDGADYYSILENIYLLTPLSRNRKLFRSGGGIKSLRAFVCGWGAKPIADMLQSKVLSEAQLVVRHSALPFRSMSGLFLVDMLLSGGRRSQRRRRHRRQPLRCHFDLNEH